MTLRRSSIVAVILLGITSVLLGAAGLLLILTLDQPASVFGFRGAVELLTLAFALVGGLLAIRRPENPIGWIFLVAGMLSGVQVLAQEYTVFALAAGNLRGARIANWIDGLIWVPITGSIAIFVTLLFPTGRLPSRRWLWVPWVGALGILVFTAGFTVSTDTATGLRNPFFELSPGVVDPLFVVGPSLYLIGVLGALGSLVMRFRRARGDERQQLRWFGAAVALVAFFITLTFAGEFLMPDREGFNRIVAAGTVLSFISIPLATGVAVLKYRLYDIDIVISRAVVVGALGAFITVVYVGIVVGLGTLVGSGGGFLLPGVAAAVVALAFQPARRRARHLANRLVYGRRATPFEVLTAFSERVAGTYAAEDVLPRMARILGEGTGAARAEVWLRAGDTLRRTASWPAEEGYSSVPLRNGDLPDLPGAERAVPVLDRGKLLGALTLTKGRGETVTPAEERLLANLSSQVGLVLLNVQLVEDLRASRQRIVAAQDQERRRLERNIHDGAQQQLVALAVKLRLAENLARKDAEKAAEMVAQVRDDTQHALEDLRDLARGIYPPLLADKGLAAALESQARKAVLPVTVEPDGVGRYPQEAEAAAYFCVLEALQNVAKYAGAKTASIQLSEENGDLVFSVTDDGRGFDPAGTPKGSGLQNMEDRLDALGGRLVVASAPGEGTTVTGRIPVQPVAAAQADSSRSGSNSDLGM
jgi:signal transduction histidine kinase